MKKIVLLAFVSVLLSMAMVVWFIRPAVAEETIYIRADGSIEGTTDISSVDNVTYTFTDNIFNQSIVVERDNIVIDGASYTVQGTGSGRGFDLRGRNNVTIKKTYITGFEYGIVLDWYSSGNSIIGNTVFNNEYGIAVQQFSDNNTLTSNTASNNSVSGIMVYRSNASTLTGNIASNNDFGIDITFSSNNTLTDNVISNNSWSGIEIWYSSNNTFYHNNFINNIRHVRSYYSTNNWDDDAGKGNYWSDYEERYPNATEIDGSGIWDTPYVIDENNQDNYPIVPEFPTWTSMLPLLIVLTVSIAIYKRRLLKTSIY